jgi:acyl-CoA reductase-like NAD-dependent aldehyde dehydrogenase
MSRRPEGAAIADLRPNGLSRRQLMVGSAATTVMARVSLDNDPAIQACNAWQANQAEYEDLTKRWQALETHLFRNHNWSKLSRRQRAAIPEAADLDAIDDRRDELSDHERQLLMGVLQTSATTPRGLAAKLAVAASIVRPYENAEGHDLITSVLRDYRSMTEGIIE